MTLRIELLYLQFKMRIFSASFFCRPRVSLSSFACLLLAYLGPEALQVFALHFGTPRRKKFPRRGYIHPLIHPSISPFQKSCTSLLFLFSDHLFFFNTSILILSYLDHNTSLLRPSLCLEVIVVIIIALHWHAREVLSEGSFLARRSFIRDMDPLLKWGRG